MKVENLDHLGIVAGVVEQMGLVEKINTCLGMHPQQKVSPGQGVKAMILNGLGFVSAPLYLYESFFAGKATEHLLGKGIQAQHLNDDYLGRLLDKIAGYGGSKLFSVIAMAAHKEYGLQTNRYHLDSSSMSVEGNYESTEASGVKITYGYSKDHRPDLKQFILEMICSNDGGIPLAMGIADGNQADKAVFGERLQTFAQQWDVEGMLVADSALYSQDNLQRLGKLKWLTRVPLTLAQAQEVVEQYPTEALTASQQEGYRLGTVCSCYGDVPQLWVLVENTARIETDYQRVDKQVSRHQRQAQKQLRQHQKIDFRCAEDARAQTQRLVQKWTYHDLCNVAVVAIPHYEQTGRPAQGAKPSHYTYRITATLVTDTEAIARVKRRAGRFILATNDVHNREHSGDSLLRDYRGQQAPERGFRFLKDPLFFTSSVFLKTPERIAALAIVMGLSLMVYSLAQRQVRQALAAADDTVLDQRRRPTQRPTLRWLFQCFQAVHWVRGLGGAQVSNLTPERLHILRFFPQSCRRYYLLL